MTKIVLIGAGSLQFGTGTLGDIFQSKVLQGAEVVLNDINQDAVSKTLNIAEEYIKNHNLKFDVSVDGDLNNALKGADFVIISIEVGDRFKLWDTDWQIPRQYGIKQVYGENGGPGGLFHSLRIIPPILDICQAISDVAPDATVFNYSNPMSRICTTVHRKFPNLKFVGMCHEIASLERHLPPMLNQPKKNIQYRAGGLNHFSVMTEVSYVDTKKDAYPDVLKLAPKYFGTLPGYSEIYTEAKKTKKDVETEGWMDIDLSHIKDVREWSDRFLFRVILEKFGCLPITTDSHFGEYIQWAHDAADHRGIVDFYAYYRNHLGNIKPTIKDELHERVVPIMEGIITNEQYEEAAVNIPNKGFIKNLPEWIVVEVPAMISKDGVEGIPVNPPSGITALLANQIGIHDMTAEAVLQKSKELVVQALLVDPVVTESKNVSEMVEHIIAEQKPWLDYLK